MVKKQVRYKKRPNDKRFDVAKYVEQLNATGEDENSMTPQEAFDIIETFIADNYKEFPHYKTYWQLHQHLKLAEVSFLCALLNIRVMEKKSKRAVADPNIEYLKGLKARMAKELAKAIDKYPTLGVGWFRLPEQRLIRDLHIGRDIQARMIDRLRNKGLLLTLVCEMPRKRWVRLNCKLFLKLARRTYDEVELSDEEE